MKPLFGCSCGHGIRPRSTVFVLQYSAVSSAIQPSRLQIRGRIFDAGGPEVSINSVRGGPHVPVENFSSYLASGYRLKLVEDLVFDDRRLKYCFQRTAASVFGTLDPFSITNFFINRLKGAETRHWIFSHTALRTDMITNDLLMTRLVDVGANSIGV